MSEYQFWGRIAAFDIHEGFRGSQKSPTLFCAKEKIMRTSQIDKDSVGLMEVVEGWVHRTRDHGGLTFVDIRDFDGIVQCVFDTYKGTVDYHHLRDESAVRVSGEIRIRGDG